MLGNCAFAIPQSNQECFSTELSGHSLMFPVSNTPWLDMDTRPGPPLCCYQRIFFPLLHNVICTAAWKKKHIKKNTEKRTIGTCCKTQISRSWKEGKILISSSRRKVPSERGTRASSAPVSSSLWTNWDAESAKRDAYRDHQPHALVSNDKWKGTSALTLTLHSERVYYPLLNHGDDWWNYQ